MWFPGVLFQVEGENGGFESPSPVFADCLVCGQEDGGEFVVGRMRTVLSSSRWWSLACGVRYPPFPASASSSALVTKFVKTVAHVEEQAVHR